jgi:hypothetical protein
MSNSPFLAKSSNRGSVFLLVLLACLALAAMWAGRSMKMKAQAAGPAQFLVLKPGEVAKIVFEAMPSDNDLAGKLLEKQDETHYARTATEVELIPVAKTAIVMGNRANIRKGAILHVTGTLDENHILYANQLVVLTEYVSTR